MDDDADEIENSGVKVVAVDPCRTVASQPSAPSCSSGRQPLLGRAAGLDLLNPQEQGPCSRRWWGRKERVSGERGEVDGGVLLAEEEGGGGGSGEGRRSGWIEGVSEESGDFAFRSRGLVVSFEALER